MEQLNYSTIMDPKTGRNVRVSTWIEDGQWVVKITVNGVDRCFESMGPVVEGDEGDMAVVVVDGSGKVIQ